MAQQLTQKLIDKFIKSKLPENCSFKELNDLVVKGLSIRKGKRLSTYYFTRQVKGLPRKRFKIGNASDITLKQAREKSYLFNEDTPSATGVNGDYSFWPIKKYISDIYEKANSRNSNVREVSYQFDQTILNLEMLEIKPAHIQDWSRRRVEGKAKQPIFKKGRHIELRDTNKKVKPETARRGYGALRAIFNWARDRGHIPYNPISGIKITGAGETLGRGMSEDDRAAYLTAIKRIPNKRLKCFLFLLITTGARPRELLTLKRHNIKFVDDMPRALVESSFSKTKKERSLYLIPEAIIILYEYMNSKYDKRLECGKESEWLFYSPTTNTHVKSMYKTYKTWARNNWMSEDLPEYDLYAFRHTFAYQVHKHSNLATTRDLLGHNNIKTTDKYLKSNSSEQWRAVNAIEHNPVEILNAIYLEQTAIKEKVKSIKQ